MTLSGYKFHLFREKMTQAFEFALDKVGLDYNSYQVIPTTWLDHFE